MQRLLQNAAAASWARPFAFLADFPQASDFVEAETSFFQQVGFEDGPGDVVCFKFGGEIALKLKK